MRVLPLLLCLVAAAAVCRADDDDDDFEWDEADWFLVIFIPVNWVRADAVTNGPAGKYCYAYNEVGTDLRYPCCNYVYFGRMERNKQNKCVQAPSLCKLEGQSCDRTRGDFCCWDLYNRCDQRTKTCVKQTNHAVLDTTPCVHYGLETDGTYNCCTYRKWGAMAPKRSNNKIICAQPSCVGHVGAFCDKNQNIFCCWDKRLKCNQAMRQCQYIPF